MPATDPDGPSAPASSAGSVEPLVHQVVHAGAEPVVVVVHGAMDRASSFGRMARHLGDLAVVRYDRRGYGRSVELGPTDLVGHLDDLAGVVGDRPCILVGHSVGGVLALTAATSPLLGGVVVGVVAYEAPSPWAPWWPARRRPAQSAAIDPAAAAERFMRQVVGERVWARLPPSTRAQRRSEGAALQADLALVAGDPPYDLAGLAGLATPVLALAGSETSWWQRRASEELALRAAAGSFGLISGAGHGAHLTHPHDLAALVRAFRDRIADTTTVEAT